MKHDFNKVIGRRNTDSIKWDKADEDILPMWIADMDFEAPKPVVDAMVKRAEHGIYGYPLPSAAYHQSVIDWMKRRHQWEIKEEWIAHSIGIVPALHFVVQAYTEPEDKVLMLKPIYYPFMDAANMNKREIVSSSLILQNGRYEIDFEDFEKKAAMPGVKLFLLCSPHNPVGRVWSHAELSRLGEICLRNQIIVVSDEIHQDLVYKPHRHIPFASIQDTFGQNSITCVSPSKTFNLAGLQTSFLIIPAAAVRQKYIDYLETHCIRRPNTFGVVAVQAAYQYGEEWLEQLLDYLQENLNYLKGFIKEHLPSIKVIEPEATYLIWLDCRGLGMDGPALHEFFMKKAKVFLDEGYIFGEEGYGFERINIACPRSMLTEGLQRIEKACRTSNLI